MSSRPTNNQKVDVANYLVMLDIIIPLLNEETILVQKADYYHELSQQGQLIFADGGSTDKTVEIASRYGPVIHSRRGRSYQKNTAVRHTQSKYLLFLHVDSFVTPDSIRTMLEAFQNGATSGCFTLNIIDQGRIFRLYEWAVNRRARRNGIVDGDLGFFIRRDIFEQMNGFDKLPIMDDIVFSKRLQKTHKLSVLKNPIQVSSRKWHEQGFIKTFTQYTLAYLQLWTGIPFFKDQSQTQSQHNSEPQHNNEQQSERINRLRAGTQTRPS